MVSLADLEEICFVDKSLLLSLFDVINRFFIVTPDGG
jgi:hypothetical protein